jgi:hypothetical protein
LNLFGPSRKNSNLRPKSLSRESLPGSLGRVKSYDFCEGRCALSPRWAAKRQCAPSPQACRHTLPGSTDIQCAATAGGLTMVLKYVCATAKTLPTTPTRKGKTAARAKGSVQIEQYFLCSAAQLTICSSPAEAASRLTSSMLPHVSLGASQLLKPASTTPRSYGRRHQSWHHEPQAQANC